MIGMANQKNNITFGKDTKVHALILMTDALLYLLQIDSDLVCGKLFMISVSHIKENII